MQASSYDELKREGYEQDALLDAKWASDVEEFAEFLEDYIAELKGRRDWDKTKERIRLALADGCQLPWADHSPGYLPGKEAVAVINSIHSIARLTLQKLSKKLKPDGRIRFMRNPQRCKVHIEDLKAMYGQPVSEDLLEETLGKMADESLAEQKRIAETKRQDHIS